MFKSLSIITCLLGIFGCQPITEYTSHQEYVEEHVWDRKKGIVKNYKTSLEVHWQN